MPKSNQNSPLEMMVVLNLFINKLLFSFKPIFQCWALFLKLKLLMKSYDKALKTNVKKSRKLHQDSKY